MKTKPYILYILLIAVCLYTLPSLSPYFQFIEHNQSAQIENDFLDNEEMINDQHTNVIEQAQTYQGYRYYCAHNTPFLPILKRPPKHLS